jgi:hypothetical protein
MRDRRKWLVAGAAALAIVAVQHPTAGVSIVTHDMSDPSPRRFQAAVDMGLMTLSVLVTWTNRIGQAR